MADTEDPELAVIRIPKALRNALRIEAAYRDQTIQKFVEKALGLALHKAKAAREKREARELYG